MAALASSVARGETNEIVAYLRVSTQKQGAQAYAHHHGARILREFIEVETGTSAGWVPSKACKRYLDRYDV